MRRALFLLVVTLAASPGNAQPGVELFVYGSATASAAVADARVDPAIVSQTPVGMRIQLLFDVQGEAARVVLLNAGEHSWVARLERLDHDGAGFRSWVGHLDGISDSHVVFTERKGFVSGLINAVGVTYQVRTLSPGAYLLERVDLARLRAEPEPLTADAALPGPQPIPTDEVIDVLMLYTPAARAQRGGTAQIEALASQVISDTNTAFGRSGVRIRARLVTAVELPFQEAPQMALDLAALKSSPAARTLREAGRADLVQLLVSSTDLSACGVGYLLTAEDTMDFDAYSIADVACAAQYTPTHEMGHNMGSHHAPEDGASGALFPYSYAFKDPQHRFRTIMAYSCEGSPCGRIPNFSNPAVPHDGAPTGSATQDNARSINEAGLAVANFRRSQAMPTAAPPPIPAGLRSTVMGQSVTVTWNPNGSSDAERVLPDYVLQVGTSPGRSNVFNASVGSTTGASGALPNGLYYWRVIAVNGAGPSPPSAEAQFAVGCVAPAPPQDLTYARSGRMVTLAWHGTVATAQSSYIIEAGSAPQGTNVLVAAVGTGTSVTTPAPPGTYYVRVRAQNACGTSVPSNEQVIVVP